MTTLDLSPLFRSTIGFDRLSRLMESALAGNGEAPTYPPYNIEKVDEDTYRIVMAVAGFSQDDVEVTVKENTLAVEGKLAAKDAGAKYLHRGIAGRAFERRFELADHIEVTGGSLENGLLTIDLKRVIPEALKPRTIKIAAAPSKKKTIEHAA